MPRLITTAPIEGIHTKDQPLYSFDCDNRTWQEISAAISAIARSGAASETISRAIKSDRLRLHLQPIVPISEANTKPIYEVLARLETEEKLISIGGLIADSPSDSTLAILDRRIISLVCQHAEPNVVYAVNLSGGTIAHFAIVEWIANQIKKHNINPKSIHLEITEQALAKAGKAEATIVALAALGCSIVLDDIGAGHSNTSYLHRFCRSISVLKLDGSLIRDLGDQCAIAIVIGYFTIAAELGLAVVAEQVENEQTRSLLVELWRSRFPQVNFYLQGYGIGGVEPWI